MAAAVNDGSVTVSVRVAVEPATAFVLFTEDVNAWWRSGPKYRFVAPWKGQLVFEPGAGGRFLHRHGEGVYEVGRILRWEPGRRLSFQWRQANFEADELTEVDVRFEPAGDGETLVTLEHSGWQNVPPGHPARHGMHGRRFVMMIGGWWAELLAAHKSYAESRSGTKEGS